MKRLDGLAGAMAQPTDSQEYGDLVIVATGAENPGPDAVWTGRVGRGNGWSGWSGIGQPPGGVQACGPAVASGAGGLLEIAVVGQDGAVWHIREAGPGPGAGWPAWHSLGQPGGKPVLDENLGARPPDPTPVLVTHDDESLELFVVRSDLTVWHTWQTQPGGSWSHWEPLGLPGGPGAGTLGPLVAGINADRTVALFATDILGSVQYCRQRQAGAGGSWSGWEPLGSPTPNGSGLRLAVVQNLNGQLELFMVGPNGTVWHRWQGQPAGDHWSNWASLGQPALGSGHIEAADVTVSADRSGGLVLFATSPIFEPAPPGPTPWLWWRTQPGPGQDWTGWQEYPLDVGSTTTLQVEGPVLTWFVSDLILLLREYGSANTYQVLQQATDVSLLTSWEYNYVPFDPV